MRHTLLRTALALGLLLLACDFLPIDEFEPTGTQFNINSNIEVVSITGNPDLSPNGPFTMGMTVVSKTSNTAGVVAWRTWCEISFDVWNAS